MGKENGRISIHQSSPAVGLIHQKIAHNALQRRVDERIREPDMGKETSTRNLKSS